MSTSESGSDNSTSSEEDACVSKKVSKWKWLCTSPDIKQVELSQLEDEVVEVSSKVASIDENDGRNGSDKDDVGFAVH